MNNELIKRIDYCLLNDELQPVAVQTFELCKAALSEPVASSQDESTLAFFCKYDFDNVAKIDDGRAAVFLSRDQWGEIRRAAIGKPVAASQPTELEMHRADYNSIKAAGFDSPGELLAVYNTLTKSVPQDVEEFIASYYDEIADMDSDTGVSTVIYPEDLRAWMAGHVRVPVDVLETILEVVRGKLNEAYQNAMPVCCGQPGQECCGNPVAEWNPSDIELMDSLGPVEKTISAMLTASKDVDNE